MKQINVIMLLLLFASSACSIELGDGAPKFVNPDLQTKYVYSKDVIGKSWIILDFFATDCEGCKKELPELEELYREFKDYGLIIVVFAVDEEGPAILKPYFEAHPTELWILIDRYKKTAVKYGVDEIPTLFLINPEGAVVLKQIGYSKDNIHDIKDLLTPALLEEAANPHLSEPDQIDESGGGAITSEENL